MNLYDISYCWKKAEPTCTYIVVVIFWRMIRPQKYDDHLWCHCMIVMCFDESHWCFAATSMLHDRSLLISFACLRPGRFQCGSYWVRTARSREPLWRGSKSNIGKWSPSWTPGQFVFTFATNVFWMYSNGYYGLQCPRLCKIVTTWVPQVQETSSEPGSGLVPNTCVAYLIDVSRDQCLTSMFDQTVLSLLWDISDAECFAGLLDLWEHQGWRRRHQWRERRWGALVNH